MTTVSMTTSTCSKSGFRVIQGNLQHCKLANVNLCQHFERRDYDLALIQEPYVSKKRFTYWNRLKGTMFTDISIANPRTCIFIKRNPNYTAVAVPRFCNRDLTTVRIDYERE